MKENSSKNLKLEPPDPLPGPPQVVDCFALQLALWALWFRSKPICQRFILIMNCWWNIFDHFVYTSHTRKKEIVVNLLIFCRKKRKKEIIVTVCPPKNSFYLIMHVLIDFWKQPFLWIANQNIHEQDYNGEISHNSDALSFCIPFSPQLWINLA